VKESCIIVVDDQELLLRAYERTIKVIFRNLDRPLVPTILASGYHEAVEHVAKHDEKREGNVGYMLLTDGDMLEVQGPEIIEKFDEQFGNRLLLRVLVTSEPDYKEHAKRLSAIFVEKPFDEQDLSPLIEEFLSML